MTRPVELEGLDEVLAGLDRLGEAGHREVEHAVKVSLEQVRRTAVRSILMGPKTGRLYPRPGGRVHQASAPGEAPASDSGDLARGIRTRQSGLDGVVESAEEHSSWLEFGTLNMEERPYMRPALDGNAEWILNRFRLAIEKATREMSDE